MTEPALNRAEIAKPVRNRPLWEKFLVWGGISALLIVVFIEWHTRESYNATLADLEETFSGAKQITVLELPKHVHGFARQSEVNKESTRLIKLTWSSVFKKYELRLPISPIETLSMVDTFVDDSEPTPPIRRDVHVNDIPVSRLPPNPKPAPPAPAPVVPDMTEEENRVNVERSFPPPVLEELTFDEMLPKGYEHIVAVKLKEKSDPGVNGWLVREIVRQAVLVTAEEELGLTTLDSSIGETIPIGDGSTSPLFIQLTCKSQGQMERGGVIISPFLFRVAVILHYRTKEKGYQRWKAVQLKVPQENWMESLVEQLEVCSRESYVEGLTTIGLEKVPHKRKVDRPAAPPEDHLDFASQYALIRHLLAQRQDQGETAEILGQLVRAYANLGNLIDYHWSPASKAYKARSLLYAQRLVAKYGSTPFALAHQAYARALTGRHAAALESVKVALDAKGREAPEWLNLIRSYCDYQPEELESVDGPHAELAAYLRMRMVDQLNDPQGSLLAIKRMLEANPACGRAVEALSVMNELAVKRVASEEVVEPQWIVILERLASAPNLPAPVMEILAAVSKTPQMTARDELKLRGEVIQKLLETTPIKDHPGPSAAALAGLMRDCSFVQVWRLLDLQARVLSIPTDATLAQYRSLMAGHPYEKWLESFTQDRAKAARAYVAFHAALDLETADLVMLPIRSRSAEFPNQRGLAGGFEASWKRNQDPILEDADRVYRIGWGSFLAMKVSPKWPIAIASAISMSSLEGLEKWEKSHGDSPLILKAISDRYARAGKNVDAQRCLEKLVELKPTNQSYLMLARLCKASGDTKKWKEALEKAVELPSLGLENAMAHYELAEDACDRRDWEAAKPHALAAADSYSGWGLLSAGRVFEGLEEWDEAEKYIRACSERYSASSARWYFWCARTGHGNLEEAKALAHEYWDSPEFQRGGIRDKWEVITGKLLDGDEATARELLSEIAQTGDITSVATIAILADEHGEVELRDKIFHDIEPKAKYETGFIETTNLLRGVLSGKEQCRWNRNSFELLLINSDPVLVGYQYLLAGRFLGNHGQPEIALEYLQEAAAARNGSDWAALIAIDLLRKKNVAIGPSRNTFLPESLHEVATLLAQFKKSLEQQKWDEADAAVTKALELRPNYVPALVMRGSLREANEQYSEALTDFEEALRLDPNYPPANLKLSWLLSTCPQDDLRDGKRALELAEKAVALRQFEISMNATTFAAAHAECGDFDRAIDFETRSQTLPGYAPDNGGRLATYQSRKPYRQQRPTPPAKGPQIR